MLRSGGEFGTARGPRFLCDTARSFPPICDAHLAGERVDLEIRTRLVASCLLTAFAVVVALAAAPSVLGQNPKESFTGFAINMNGGPSTATVDFTIERWSTDAERERLLSIVAEEKDVQGNEQLLQALQKMPKTGYIRTAKTLAWDLRYARQTPLEDGGRRIVLAPIGRLASREARNRRARWTIPSRLSKCTSTRTIKAWERFWSARRSSSRTTTWRLRTTANSR